VKLEYKRNPDLLDRVTLRRCDQVAKKAWSQRARPILRCRRCAARGWFSRRGDDERALIRLHILASAAALTSR